MSEIRDVSGTRGIAGRLGLNVPREVWPAASTVAAIADAGFDWIQMHAPSRAVLVDVPTMRAQACRLRALLKPFGLRLVVHAPDTLSVGVPEEDRVFVGLLEYASLAGAELLAYHGLNFFADEALARVAQEEMALRRFLPLAGYAGVRVAIENCAPLHHGPLRLSNDPIAVRDLVRRLGSPAAGMLLDLGHLNITSDIRDEDPVEIAAACAADVLLFHVHDNYGLYAQAGDPARATTPRLDLHLAPGAGTVPWALLAPMLTAHRAPLLLEVRPQHRPPLKELSRRTQELCSSLEAGIPVAA
ncbi:unannotated protein [freshwater metagenome]|uniref:Unannotated protein n=1 Tax=freshwater metagenome TaxID=449393 RepID=A0A6J7CRB6_9ZZZZ|nr:TIM barrel protein [Actinomycetota bacterium]